jgi:hypothetical protein
MQELTYFQPRDEIAWERAGAGDITIETVKFSANGIVI